MTLESLRDLFLHELRDLYNAEKQLLTALPGLVEAADADELETALRGHLKETREQRKTLETIFETLDEDPSGQKCRGMEGLIREARDVLDAEAAPGVRDLSLIAAIQRIEHYEIAGYGTARTYAEKLAEDPIADTLQGIANDEGRFDQELTRLAKRLVSEREVMATA